MTIVLDGTKGTTTPGLYSSTTFTGTYADGIVVDYTTGLGRISVGTSDGLAFYNAGVATTELMRLDASGNLGLGVTPSAWSTGGSTKVIELQSSLGTTSIASGYSALQLNNNVYYNGTNNIYKASGVASAFYIGGNSFQFLQAASGTAGNPITFTQAMTLDASGNLGIGVTSPAAKLDVAGAVSATPVTNGVVRILTTGANPATGYGGGLLFAQQNSGGTYSNYASITGSRVNNAANDKVDLVFSTGSPGDSIAIAERMRLDTSGNLLVGDTATTAGSRFVVHQTSTSDVRASYILQDGGWEGLSILCTKAAYSDVVFRLATNRAASTSFWFNNYAANGVDQFKLRGDGTLFAQNTTIQSVSDIRLKENIVDAEDGLATITALRPVRFDFKEGFGNGRKNVLGFIAQEMEQVFPDAVDVFGESDDPEDPYKSVGTGALIPVLVKAIQEQQAIIQQLQADVAALKGN